MVALTTNGQGPFPPEHLYVFVSDDRFIYLAEIALKEPIKEIAKCKVVWDSINTMSEQNLEAYRASHLKDTTSFNKGIELDEIAFKKYCECYHRELKNDKQFDSLLKQAESIATYLEPASKK
ncbi:MAG: hypothetical protein JSS79_10875 [Bacteroidetes bacterium]|nr:hypothetical protein [Bacteroidota bacterium]